MRRAASAGEQPSGQAEQQPALAVGGLAVLHHVQGHGVLVAVQEQQARSVDRVSQCGDDTEQKRAVPTDHDRDRVVGDCVGDTLGQLLDHG
jgi:hypothetical protein